MTAKTDSDNAPDFEGNGTVRRELKAVRDKKPVFRQNEHEMQAALFQWWRWKTNEPLRSLMFAIPNGGARSRITGARLKAEGVRAGVPDILLAYPVKPFHGLFIELKTRKGRLSEKQLRMLFGLYMAGYLGVVCRSLDKAQEVIINYLKGSMIKKTGLDYYAPNRHEYFKLDGICNNDLGRAATSVFDT